MDHKKKNNLEKSSVVCKALSDVASLDLSNIITYSLDIPLAPTCNVPSNSDESISLTFSLFAACSSDLGLLD